MLLRTHIILGFEDWFFSVETKMESGLFSIHTRNLKIYFYVNQLLLLWVLLISSGDWQDEGSRSQVGVTGSRHWRGWEWVEYLPTQLTRGSGNVMSISQRGPGHLCICGRPKNAPSATEDYLKREKDKMLQCAAVSNTYRKTKSAITDNDNGVVVPQPDSIWLVLL